MGHMQMRLQKTPKGTGKSKKRENPRWQYHPIVQKLGNDLFPPQHKFWTSWIIYAWFIPSLFIFVVYSPKNSICAKFTLRVIWGAGIYITLVSLVNGREYLRIPTWFSISALIKQIPFDFKSNYVQVQWTWTWKPVSKMASGKNQMILNIIRMKLSSRKGCYAVLEA